MTGSLAVPAVELFVYYRIDVQDLATAHTAVHTMQAALCAAHPGLQAKLVRRPEPQESVLTLMEVYGLPASNHAAIEAAIDTAARAALGAWLRGDRHAEVFVPCV